jgi:single-strand DNA-binding protein
MNVNKIICTGRLTKDPELRTISDDMKVCQLRLAVDGMGRGREVGYINVSVFGKAGEAAAEYLAKGWLVAVDGRVEYGEWETDGTKRHDYMVVGNVEFLTAPRPAQEPEADAQPKEEPAKPAPVSASRWQRSPSTRLAPRGGRAARGVAGLRLPLPLIVCSMTL